VTDQDTDALTIDQLTEVRIHAKLLWDSGILEPHEKEHMWKVLMRIDGKVKEIREQEGSLRQDGQRRVPLSGHPDRGTFAAGILRAC